MSDLGVLFSFLVQEKESGLIGWILAQLGKLIRLNLVADLDFVC